MSHRETAYFIEYSTLYTVVKNVISVRIIKKILYILQNQNLALKFRIE